ncbi:MAG: Tricarboxylate transporter family protein [Desulfobacula sp.]|nr:Tricarboxylate transporter family protein [Desulfobacula sp.]
MMEVILAGFLDAFTLTNISFIFLGITMGVFVGAIPGLNGPMAIALAVPMTYYMPSIAAISFLIGINKGGTYGGSIAAILLNTPGSPEAAATCYDGYPLAKQGKGEKALKIALYSSIFGDTFSDLVLILVAAPIAIVALKMGPPEILSVIVFALTIIAGLESKQLVKGLIGAGFGIFLASVGMDPNTATPRLTFGLWELENGISLMALGIGTLALSEVLVQLEVKGRAQDKIFELDKTQKKENRQISFQEFRSVLRTLVRSSLIGTAMGALPGLGAVIASFLGYGAAKRASKDPESFGKGNIEGIAAAEAANNAVIGSNLIPLFTLGIPGNVASAMLIGAFIIHGVTPGPLMFEEHGRLVYGIYGGMLIGNVFNLIVGAIGLRIFVRVLSIPRNIIYPVVIFICITGAYIADSSLFAVGMMIFFAILGYFMKKLEFSFVTFIVGFVLGPMFEMSLQQTLIMSRNNIIIIFQRPIVLIFLVFTIVFLWRVFRRSNKTPEKEPG